MAFYRVCPAAAVAAAGLAAAAGLGWLIYCGVDAAPVVVGHASTVIPFPAPPADVGLGGLHTFSAFQCRLLRDGPPGRCAPPVQDDGWGERATTDEDPDGKVSAGPGADDDDSNDYDVFGRPPGQLAKLFEDLSRIYGPSHAFSKLSKTISWAVPRRAAAAGAKEHRMPYAGAVTRALTLRRNSLGGYVRRVRGEAYDVLILSHSTAGQCPGDARGGCGLPTALATLGARKGAPMSALTVTTPASGGAVAANASAAAAATPTIHATRLVTMSDMPLLSVGRAVLADGRWLSAPDPLAPPSATITMRLGWTPPSPLRQFTSWVLGDGSAAGVAESASWLGATAAVLCGVAPSTFLDDKALCQGVPPARLRRRLRRRFRHDGQRPSNDKADKEELVAVWEVGPSPTAASDSAPPVEPCASTDSGNNNSSEPPPATTTTAAAVEAMLAELSPSGPPYRTAAAAWLGTDDAAAGGTAEPSPLSRFGVCTPRVPSPPPTTGRVPASSPPSIDGSAIALDASLVRSALETTLDRSDSFGTYASVQYVRPTFQVDAPPPPATDIELLLAVIVVVPEVAALALLGLTSSTARRGQELERRCRRRRRDQQAYLLILFTGVVSLAGIGVLAAAERRGARWRAAAVAEEATALRPDHGSGWAGVFVTHTERLTIIAAVGHRPRLAEGLAIGLATAYAVVATVSGQQVVGWPRRRRSAAVGLSGTDTETGFPEGWAEPQAMQENAT